MTVSPSHPHREVELRESRSCQGQAARARPHTPAMAPGGGSSTVETEPRGDTAGKPGKHAGTAPASVVVFFKCAFTGFRERKAEGDRNIHDERESGIGCPLQAGPPLGIEPPTPDREANQQPLGSWGDAQPQSHTVRVWKWPFKGCSSWGESPSICCSCSLHNGSLAGFRHLM